ncbi:MAG: hypothetical protein IJ272_09275 [Clostridia bacterium]|nr:hypothetical protein [Clostridia bacterium]
MITILIAVILIVYAIKQYTELSEGLFFFLVVAGIVCLILGFVPMAGFEEAVLVEEVELMPLRLEEETDKVYYAYKEDSATYSYAYDNRETYGLSGEAYQEDKIYSTHIKVYESEECVTPVLKKFESKSKVTWYTIAGMWNSEEYIFYIPVGTTKELE